MNTLRKNAVVPINSFLDTLIRCAHSGQILCFPVPSVDLSVTSFELGEDLKVGMSTSFKLTAHIRLSQMELPASDWPHFDYKLYVSKDKKLDADFDYEIPYRFVRRFNYLLICNGSRLNHCNSFFAQYFP